MERFSVSADALAAKLPLLCAGPAVNDSAIRQSQHDVKSVVVLLVGNSGAGQPPIKALHSLSLHALFMALIVGLASFTTTVPTAARISNIIPDELAATEAVTAIFHVVFVEAHRDTVIGGLICSR
ncbi:hypothetical protein [Pseudomonas sp. URMO17WK12:I12]|uniref:hypothetical protein n=1 Tax=Pseudomonas sp. URMO17WK12:I12 TaxID=1259797 RepID=UPI000488C3EA|nr:hypothetical protein [Pseudomonas sp. URMO17WK12:I12]